MTGSRESARRSRFGSALTAWLLALATAIGWADDSWLPVRYTDLATVPGSVLDLSFLVSEGPAGRLGRVVVNRNGHLAFATQADQPQRFLCASQPLGPYAARDLPGQEYIDAYVRQLRMHGYNMARLPRIEQLLMRHRGKDFDFDPEQLDRFQYLLAALKREGIYWLMYGLATPRGAYAGDVVESVRRGVYYNPAHQQHWRELVTRLFTAINPHTGLTTLDDPALAGIILVNEGGLNFQLRKQSQVPAELRARFVAWLRERYGDSKALANAWKPDGLAKDESLEKGVIALPESNKAQSPRMADLQRFYLALEQETLQWMTEHLRKLGYQGLITAFDSGVSLQADASRAQLDWVDMHRYHDYPKGFVKAGTRRLQTSSISGDLRYLRQLAISRFGGRPYTVSEYGQPFWNAWRRESGLTAPSYAGFQDWDMICRMASAPIALGYGETGGKRKDAVYPFSVGMDPIGRAAETLAALLFLRRDVAPARSRVGVVLTPEYVFDVAAGVGRMPQEVSNLSLVSGVGLLWQDDKSGRSGASGWQPDALMRPDEAGLKLFTSGDSLSAEGNGARSGWSTRTAVLSKGGILPADNRTSGARAVFESDTGELLLETRQRRMRVVTPKTEGVVFDGGLPIALSAFSVESASGPALVAVSALDGLPLKDSRRMLVVFATDALNSGMQFKEPERKTLLKLGRLPVLLRAENATVRLSHRRPGQLRLYASALNGERTEQIPVETSAEAIRFTLDTGRLQHGPTTFFELVDISESIAAGQVP